MYPWERVVQTSRSTEKVLAIFLASRRAEHGVVLTQEIHCGLDSRSEFSGYEIRLLTWTMSGEELDSRSHMKVLRRCER